MEPGNDSFGLVPRYLALPWFIIKETSGLRQCYNISVVLCCYSCKSFVNADAHFGQKAYKVFSHLFIHSFIHSLWFIAKRILWQPYAELRIYFTSKYYLKNSQLLN